MNSMPHLLNLNPKKNCWRICFSLAKSVFLLFLSAPIIRKWRARLINSSSPSRISSAVEITFLGPLLMLSSYAFPLPLFPFSFQMHCGFVFSYMNCNNQKELISLNRQYGFSISVVKMQNFLIELLLTL